MSQQAALPTPDAAARAHSQQLAAQIQQEIMRAGVISFARFMELALYAPGLGYYSAGAQKFGADGDFVTAPEISPLFSRCVARQCQQVLTDLTGGDILEFGAGSGAMAAALLAELAAQKCLPAQYYILEISADLRARQRATLQRAVPHLLQKVIWLDALPATPLRGIILANEVLDAMPVQRFVLERQVNWELGVGVEQAQLVLQKLPIFTPNLKAALATLRAECPCLSTTTAYASEINLTLMGWLKSVAQSLQQGVVLLIDYGFGRAEYYHPQRAMGTLMCHYRHRAHADPFWWPGLQDITAHVDFTAVAEAAHAAGLAISGFTNQAGFLLACGLLTMAEELVATANLKAQFSVSQQVQKLTAPHEMGELFKVIALTKNYRPALLGFALQDLRRQL